VGKATNLRQRVRSYFSGDDRRKIGSLLRETHDIRHLACATTLEAAVTEVRLIHEHQPRYNRVAKRWRAYAYVKLTLDETFPRLAVVKAARRDGGLYIGPLPSANTARLVAEAVNSVVPLRRCTARLSPARLPVRDAPCTPAQLGVATCPCSGGIDAVTYRRLVDVAARGLTTDPSALLGPLADRMAVLASAERYEEAADVRDRAAALSSALARQRRVDALRGAGVVRLAFRRGGGAEVHNGVLVRTWADEAPMLPLATGPEPPASDQPLPLALADEVGCIAGWLDAEAARVRLEHCDGGLASRVGLLPSFQPGAGPARSAQR